MEKQRWEEFREGQRREEKRRRKKIREGRVRGKKMQAREKVEKKSRNTVFYQWFVAADGRKVGWLKRRVRSQLARWEMKNCTPLWREAHVEVHGSEHFWKLSCRKIACGCGAHVSKPKCTKHTMLGALLEVETSKKCTPLWCEAHFQVKFLKAPHARTTFDGSDAVLRGIRRGFCTWPKVSKMWWFCSMSKNDGRRGTFEEDLERCMSRGRGSTRDMFIRDVRRSGRWFPERGCILEHQIFSFAKIILRDTCSTSYDLASLFRGRRNTWETWTGKIAKRIGTRPSALHSTFYYWRKSRRIASFLMLSTSKNEEVSKIASFLMLPTSKNEEVSQNRFVFDVANFKNRGSLAELLRSWCCQLRKLRQSCRIASLLMLPTAKIEEVSQNRFVFDVTKFTRWGSLAE